MKRVMLAVLLLCLSASAQLKVQLQNGGTPAGTYSKWLPLNFVNGGCAANATTGAMDCTFGVTGAVSLSGLTNPAANKSLDMTTRTLNFNFTGNYGTDWGISVSSNAANAATGYLFKVNTGAGSNNKVVSFLNGASKGLYIDADGIVRITDQLYIGGHRFTFSDLAAGNIPIGTYYVDMAEIAAPANPAAGSCRFWVDSTTHQITFKNSAGTSCIAASGSESYPGVTSDSANGLAVTGKVAASSVETSGPGAYVSIPDGGTAGANKLTSAGGAVKWGLLPVTQTIASGTATLGTTSIAAGQCATAVTVSATGVATTDVISWTPNADISGVTGYTPSGTLRIYPYPTANNVSFKVCNGSASDAVTPGAVVLNWRVTR